MTNLHPDLNKNEKEVIKLMNHFKKKVISLRDEGKFDQDLDAILASFELMTEKLNAHAELRSNINQKREMMASIIKDNAVCPKCNQTGFLKLAGERKVEEGWMHNAYKCRKCNIEFTWGKPNNPWDMRSLLNQHIIRLQKDVEGFSDEDPTKESTKQMLEHITTETKKLSDALDTIDSEYSEMKQQDESVNQKVFEFKNYLLIEKIKLDALSGPQND